MTTLWDYKPNPERKDETVIAFSVPIKENAVGFTTVLAVAEVMQEALRLVAEKSVGYGEAWRSQGWMGNLARIQSKTSRLRNMLWTDIGGQRDDANETTEDTALDLLNLSVFFLINKRNGNKWGPRV